MNKSSIYLTLTLIVLAQSFSNNLQASFLQEIGVEYDPKAVTVKVVGDDLFVRSIDKSISFSAQTTDENKIKIMGFPVAFTNPTVIAYDGEITHLENIKEENKIFNFHNGGFAHLAETHEYKNCLYNFEKKEAAVTLTGKKSQNDSSEVINDFLSQKLGNMQLNLTAVDHNLLNLFGNLIGSHMKNPLEDLKPIVPDTCSIQKIKVQSSDLQYRQVNVNGKFAFKEQFEMFTYFKNASLTLTTGENFYFLLSEMNNSNDKN